MRGRGSALAYKEITRSVKAICIEIRGYLFTRDTKLTGTERSHSFAVRQPIKDALCTELSGTVLPEVMAAIQEMLPLLLRQEQQCQVRTNSILTGWGMAKFGGGWQI